jgi:hypothetical protein
MATAPTTTPAMAPGGKLDLWCVLVAAAPAAPAVEEDDSLAVRVGYAGAGDTEEDVPGVVPSTGKSSPG